MDSWLLYHEIVFGFVLLLRTIDFYFVFLAPYEVFPSFCTNKHRLQQQIKVRMHYTVLPSPNCTIPEHLPASQFTFFWTVPLCSYVGICIFYLEPLSRYIPSKCYYAHHVSIYYFLNQKRHSSEIQKKKKVGKKCMHSKIQNRYRKTIGFINHNHWQVNQAQDSVFLNNQLDFSEAEFHFEERQNRKHTNTERIINIRLNAYNETSKFACLTDNHVWQIGWRVILRKEAVNTFTDAAPNRNRDTTN